MEQSKSPKALAYASISSSIQILENAKQPKIHQNSLGSPNETQQAYMKNYWAKFLKRPIATFAIWSSRTKSKAMKRSPAIITMPGGSHMQR